MRILHEDQDTRETMLKKLEELALHILVEKPLGEYEITIKKPSRSNPQNKAMHKYFAILSDELNKAGFTKNAVLTLLKSELPWDEEGVKRDLWGVFQEHLGLGKKTSKLKTNEVTKVYDLCNLFTSTKLNMDHIPFPNLSDKDLLK